MSDYTRKAMAEARHRMCDYCPATIAIPYHGVSVGLIEAAEWHKEQAKIYRYRSANTFVGGEHALSLMARIHDESAAHFRARAAYWPEQKVDLHAEYRVARDEWLAAERKYQDALDTYQRSNP